MRKLLLLAAIAAGLALPAWADGYFKGKTITYIIATSPGGGYDTYARVIGKYLQKKLGAGKIIFKNLPGAGHIFGANTLYASKPDGLTIGTFNTGLIYAQILGQDGIQFDLNKFSWVGKAAADARVVVLDKNAGLKDFQALLDSKDQVNFAASGIGSASYNETKMLIDGLDLNVKIIPGFNGNEGEMAMMRGEIAGQVGSESSLQPFVDAGNGFFAAGIGGDVTPQVIDFAKTDKGRSIVSLIDANSNLARLTAAPPGVDPAVLQELRDGYMAVMKDPDFLAEADKLGIPIDPAGGDKVAELVAAALQQDDETKAIIAEALSTEGAPELPMASGPILSLDDKHKEMQFKDGDKTVTAEISGSRTAITIDGAQADRDALKVGMVCDITYDPNADGNEPKSMDCKM
jgi:tripartite-type tricarboxylate transporter receptor subunit TctC